MPIPSLTQRIHDEAFEKGLEKGMEKGIGQGLAQVAALLLRRRFGDDPRIPGLARRLAPLGPDTYLDLIDRAADLDELTAGS